MNISQIIARLCDCKYNLYIIKITLINIRKGDFDNENFFCNKKEIAKLSATS